MEVAADPAPAVQEAFEEFFVATCEEGGSVTEPGRLLWRAVRAAVLRRDADPAAPDAEVEEERPQGDDIETILRRANLELPRRQREVLAISELEDFSYEVIGNVTDLSPIGAAQLTWRGLRRLRALALRAEGKDPDPDDSLQLMSHDCEYALTLLELRDRDPDGPPPPDLPEWLEQRGLPADVQEWLDRHVAGCSTCPRGRAAVDEARARYRRLQRVRAVVSVRDRIILDAENAFGSVRKRAEREARRAERRRVARRSPVGAGAAVIVLLVLSALATHFMPLSSDDRPPRERALLPLDVAFGLPGLVDERDGGDRTDDDDDDRDCRLAGDCPRPRECPPDCPPPTPDCRPDCPPPGNCPPHCPPPPKKCPPHCPPPKCPPTCPPPKCPPTCPPPECPPVCDPVTPAATGPPGLGGDLPSGRGGGPPGHSPGLPPGRGGAVLPPGRGGVPPGRAKRS
ncbi:MAG TPA: hypothetical protein VF529_01470 [Solirubrobacteraceae bacterium]